MSRSVTLTYQKTGKLHEEFFDSPSDAIDRGVELLLTKSGSPVHVKSGSKIVASKDDMFLLWEEAVKVAS